MTLNGIPKSMQSPLIQELLSSINVIHLFLLKFLLQLMHAIAYYPIYYFCCLSIYLAKRYNDLERW